MAPLMLALLSVMVRMVKTCNENNSSSNEPGDDNDSAQSSEDNDNSDKDTTILIPTHVNTPDYEDICALKWGREHYLRFFPSIKTPLHIRSNKKLCKAKYILSQPF